MADIEPYKLFVFILGGSLPLGHSFSITATASDSVGKLKELIYAEAQNSFKGIDAKDLTLWKVLCLCSFRRIMY
jgi:hypothetical protein